MKMDIHDRALVLRLRRYGEADAACLFLGRESGLHTWFARGAFKSQKRFGGCLDLFHHLDFRVESRADGTGQLKEALLLNGFPGIRENWERFWMASCLTEIATTTLEEGAEASREYILLGCAFQLLSQSEPVHAAAAVFLLHWFRHQGWLPDQKDWVGAFRLTEREVELWTSILGSSMEYLASKRGALQECDQAPRWFDQLIHWAMDQHGLNLKVPLSKEIRC